MGKNVGDVVNVFRRESERGGLRFGRDELGGRGRREEKRIGVFAGRAGEDEAELKLRGHVALFRGRKSLVGRGRRRSTRARC